MSAGSGGAKKHLLQDPKVPALSTACYLPKAPWLLVCRPETSPPPAHFFPTAAAAPRRRVLCSGVSSVSGAVRGIAPPQRLRVIADACTPGSAGAGAGAGRQLVGSLRARRRRPAIAR